MLRLLQDELQNLKPATKTAAAAFDDLIRKHASNYVVRIQKLADPGDLEPTGGIRQHLKEVIGSNGTKTLSDDD